MKKARIILSAITLLSLGSISLALNAVKRSSLVYYTTTIKNAICTKTLTHATTTADPSVPIKYYTFVDNQPCSLSARLTKIAQ